MESQKIKANFLIVQKYNFNIKKTLKIVADLIINL